MLKIHQGPMLHPLFFMWLSGEWPPAGQRSSHLGGRDLRRIPREIPRPDHPSHQDPVHQEGPRQGPQGHEHPRLRWWWVNAGLWVRSLPDRVSIKSLSLLTIRPAVSLWSEISWRIFDRDQCFIHCFSMFQVCQLIFERRHSGEMDLLLNMDLLSRTYGIHIQGHIQTFLKGGSN